jgi:hypothetical protein
MISHGQLSFSRGEIETFLGAFVGVAEEVDVRFLWRPNLPDESDNFVYELAVAASPATIVTHNIRDFRAAEIEWPSVAIKTPYQVITEASRHA